MWLERERNILVSLVDRQEREREKLEWRESRKESERERFWSVLWPDEIEREVSCELAL